MIVHSEVSPIPAAQRLPTQWHIFPHASLW